MSFNGVNIDMSFGICAMLALLLGLCLFGLIRTRHILMASLLLAGMSLLMTLLYLVLDAPDVALTEAAVGVSLSSLFVWMALQEVSETENRPSKKTVWQAGVVTVMFIGVLMYAMLDAPKLGDPTTLIHQNIAKQYLERTSQEIGISSVVAAILASYRGLDTLGETLVVLIAVLAVATLLSTEDVPKSIPRKLEATMPIAIYIAIFCLPFAWLFGAYILWHGEISPGGGFQAGALWATAWMLYLLMFGNASLTSFLPVRRLLYTAVVGIVVYSGVGIVCMLYGGEFLRYQALPFASTTAQRVAIMLVEFGIAATVTASLIWIGSLLLTETTNDQDRDKR